ncbi:putative RNA-directed DNA polymerase from transposon X-element [Araneus ventricosus]|uniref:Putative RNA-directed DNA polymerase from transposon X-element n=1 Tax=Araneus ventricosus TaxID=182803 RepID=A0A4Y2QGB8_ARAVE|nr:putative RNA-directed DNA polymerase from transposon X-element [Araneus ventricosus]
MGTFLSWNGHGIRSKFQDLKGLISIFNPVCIGFQETFLSSNNPLKLRNYNSVRKDAAIGSNHSGGVCIFTSNLYPSTPLTLHTSLQAVAVQVHTRSLVTVCYVYLPPHDVVNQQDLDTLVDQLPTPFIFKQLWKKFKAANGIYREFSFPILNTGNVTHSAPLDIANTLGHAFAQVSATDSYGPDFVAIKNRAERSPLRFTALSTLPYNSEFRIFELETALSRTHDTSPGPDGITYNMLRHLNTTSLSHLLFLFNRIWTEQKYPLQWHGAIVIPILKPGKDPSNPLHYRPIALTSCLCKTFERMVNARLVFELEKQGCISPLQSGFRRDRSTFDNLVLLETQIRNACVRRNHLVSIFFDIEKSYDRTWRYGILLTLFNFGFRGNLPIFLRNFLSHRTFRVPMGNFYSNHFMQSEGVPQGSVLSVTLFTFHLSQILHHLPSSVHGNLYVDDLQISCQGSNMTLIERQLQNEVNKLVA